MEFLTKSYAVVFTNEPVLLKIEEDGIEKLVPSGVKELNYGDLYINFEQGIYVYQGKEIYLTKKEKEYLMKFFLYRRKLVKRQGYFA